MHAQAIETIYRGNRFRSRTEARWAVFFDALGLKYEYEREGYRLNDGSWYLPDFWIKSLKMWVEIKPDLTFVDCESGLTYTQYSHPTLSLMRTFQSSVLSPVACIFGQPGEHRVWFFAWDISNGGAGEYEDDNALWCASNGMITLNVHIANPYRHICNGDLRESMLDHFTYPRDHGYVIEPIENAIRHARQARFEHGDKPFIR